MIHTDGEPTIASGTSADFRRQAAERDAETVAAAERITASAAKVIKCPNCEAPDNEEPAPVSMGRLGGLNIWACVCCGLNFSPRV